MKVGDKVLVWNTTLGGEVVKDGIAIIRKIIKNDSECEPGSYFVKVEFEDEPGIAYQRMVFDKDIIKDN
jgi:hypothetical protein